MNTDITLTSAEWFIDRIQEAKMQLHFSKNQSDKHMILKELKSLSVKLGFEKREVNNIIKSWIKQQP